MSSLLTVEQLAEFIHKSRASIRSDATRNPQSLPPICRLPNTKRLLWRLEDVESWLAAHVTSPATQEPAPRLPKVGPEPKSKARPGRPTKAAQLAKQKQLGTAQAAPQLQQRKRG